MTRAETPSNGAAVSPPLAVARCRGTLGLGLGGAILCYLAHPPVDWSLLAWVGPVPWLLLVRAPRLPGRRPYLALWFGGVAFWLAAIQWIRLPFWANIFALFLMAAYLGVYLPVFVGLTRVAVHRLRVPLWLAGAVVWTGLEWARAHLLTGFLMASLAHTQVKFPIVIQIADLVGEYGVTFVIVLVAGALASVLPLRWVGPRSPVDPNQPPSLEAKAPPRRPALLRLAPGAVALVATLVYGEWTLLTDGMTTRRPGPSLALVQSDMRCDWKGTPERDDAAMRQQIDLSLSTVRDAKAPIDVIVWPETMFRNPIFIRDAKNPPAEGAIPELRFTGAIEDLRWLARKTDAALLVGIDRVMASKARPPAADDEVELLVYNAAVFVDRDGEIQGTYDKMHLLPFGEFIPFAEWLPFLADYVPITGNSLWGARPAAFTLDGVVYAPNICYETVLPHLIRRQTVELASSGKTPDVLVNLTNDSWYWGSSELDMHLASGVFRAVEMRTPLVIAANRGLSAYVDYLGRVVAVTERDRADLLVVDVTMPPRNGPYPSAYARYGDWFALSCLVCCVILAVVGRRRLPA